MPDCDLQLAGLLPAAPRKKLHKRTRDAVYSFGSKRYRLIRNPLDGNTAHVAAIRKLHDCILCQHGNSPLCSFTKRGCHTLGSCTPRSPCLQARQPLQPRRHDLQQELFAHLILGDLIAAAYNAVAACDLRPYSCDLPMNEPIINTAKCNFHVVCLLSLA